MTKTTFRLKEEVIIRSVGEEAVLLNLQTHQYYSLNSIGTLMLDLLLEGISTEEAVEVLLKEFDTCAEDIQHEIEKMVNNLHNNGLIELN